MVSLTQQGVWFYNLHTHTYTYSHFLTFEAGRGSNSASARFPMTLAFAAFSSTVFKTLAPFGSSFMGFQLN
jgi:hypothetical protein